MNFTARASLCLALLWSAGLATAATYEVGPGRELTAIGQVPWESLQPGDKVLIHARPEPYREKFVLCRAGTSNAPITVRGVADATGRLPVIDGADATTRTNLSWWGEVRGVIKIGGARVPADTMPAHIVLENLDVCGGLKTNLFTSTQGEKLNYRRNAAAVYVEKCEHLVIRNCRLHDCGNGLFISSNDDRASRDILVEGCYIHDNGNPGSGMEHNIYTAAIGIVFQNNRLGPLRPGCPGNNLKDRSAGLVVRYNWIEGGNKELDLVDAQDSALIREDARYHETYVYGNVLLKLPRDGHAFLVNYGGDGDKLSEFRKGTLYFFNNTIVYYRIGAVLFRLSSKDEHCDFRNNIVHLATGRGKPIMLEQHGRLALSHNWFSGNYGTLAFKNARGMVSDDQTSIAGTAPGFVNLKEKDFRLTANSPCRNVASPTPRPVTREYLAHQSSTLRPDDGQLDIGAFEFQTKPPR